MRSVLYPLHPKSPDSGLLLPSARCSSDALRLLNPQLIIRPAAPILLLQLRSMLRSSSKFPFLFHPQIHLILKFISSAYHFWDQLGRCVQWCRHRAKLPAAHLPVAPALNCFSRTERLLSPCALASAPSAAARRFITASL